MKITWTHALTVSLILSSISCIIFSCFTYATNNPPPQLIILWTVGFLFALVPYLLLIVKIITVIKKLFK